jgi:hypothetical protein
MIPLLYGCVIPPNLLPLSLVDGSSALHSLSHLHHSLSLSQHLLPNATGLEDCYLSDTDYSFTANSFEDNAATDLLRKCGGFTPCC